MYAFLVTLIRGLLHVFSPFKAIGLDNVPDGPVILAANHMSLLDPLLIASCLRRKVYFLAKKELFVPVFGAILRALCVIPVERGVSDLGAIRQSIALLKEGHAYGIFPQGSRTFKNGGAFKPGVALIAQKSGAPVIPVLIDHRAHLFHRVKVYFGEPVSFESLDGYNGSERLQAAASHVEQAVYALNPLNLQ